jgi:GNAT superfamily N-acetyltransferase
MQYWWVNQNQTYRHEFAGGYLWSPKRKSNGDVNPYYESMREVAPGDLVLSFVDTRIVALGVALSHCYEFPKPTEFGSAGDKWASLGWRVDVKFSELENRIRPADQIDRLRPLLPSKYSPLLIDGRGSQSIYLVGLSTQLFQELRTLIGGEVQESLNTAVGLIQAYSAEGVTDREIAIWEDRVHKTVEQDTTLPATEREAVIQARRGQGLFRQRVSAIETRCRVTGVSNPELLRASHCKPWRDSSNQERLDGENGLLLTPSVDHLFDRGFIGFDPIGELVISPVADKPSLARMGVATDKTINVGPFSEGQRRYLEWHLELVLLKSRQRTMVLEPQVD